MIKFKHDVDITGIQKECIQGMCLVARIFDDVYQRDLVVTSVVDGKHREGSLHYQGLAFDVRTWTTNRSGVQMSSEDKTKLASLIALELGDDWDVVIESTHIHCEYDPI